MTEPSTPTATATAVIAPTPVVTITPRDNGPYRVTGPVLLKDVDGNAWPVAEGKAVWLCRCGHSETKPFCDSSHGRVGFESVVRAPQSKTSPEG